MKEFDVVLLQYFILYLSIYNEIIFYKQQKVYLPQEYSNLPLSTHVCLLPAFMKLPFS